MFTAILIAFIAAIPPTFVGWLNHRKGEEIHILVNSNLTAVKTDLALANQKITELQALILKLTSNAHPDPV